MRAYTYTGIASTTYPWGIVRPGAVAYFADRPPDTDWSQHIPPVPPVAVEPGGETGPELMPPSPGTDMSSMAGGTSRPNKAASAADWVAYALADGGFQAATGVRPDEATRRAIVDHYSAGQPDDGTDQ